MTEPKRKSAFTRRVRWPLEAAGFHIWIGLCRALPVETASNLGGWIGRTLGPRLPVNRLGHRNLRLAFPEMPEPERRRVLLGMWDNLGRTAAEYAHLDRIVDPANGRVETVGFDNVQPSFDAKVPGIAFSAHLANFEVMHLMASARARDSVTIARDPNNPHIHSLLERLRSHGGGARVPKGTDGARAALATLKRRGLVCVLLDQRMRNGVRVPFFGQPADTAAAPAQMAVRSGAAVHPTRLERLGPARFRMTMYPALPLPTEGSRNDKVAALTQAMNRCLEGWIVARPSDWLWVHRRWPHEVYAVLEDAPASVSTPSASRTHAPARRR